MANEQAGFPDPRPGMSGRRCTAMVLAGCTQSDSATVKALVAELAEDRVGVDAGVVPIGGEHHVDRVRANHADLRQAARLGIGRRERKRSTLTRRTGACGPQIGGFYGVYATVLPLNDKSLALLHVERRWCNHHWEVYGR